MIYRPGAPHKLESKYRGICITILAPLFSSLNMVLKLYSAPWQMWGKPELGRLPLKCIVVLQCTLTRRVATDMQVYIKRWNTCVCFSPSHCSSVVHVLCNLRTTLTTGHCSLCIVLCTPASLPHSPIGLRFWHIIKPTRHAGRPCPGNPCHFLSDYAENGMQYFPSNVIMIFLPGIHMLYQCLPVRDVTSVVLIGANVGMEKCSLLAATTFVILYLILKI